MFQIEQEIFTMTPLKDCEIKILAALFPKKTSRQIRSWAKTIFIENVSAQSQPAVATQTPLASHPR